MTELSYCTRVDDDVTLKVKRRNLTILDLQRSSIVDREHTDVILRKGCVCGHVALVPGLIQHDTPPVKGRRSDRAAVEIIDAAMRHIGLGFGGGWSNVQRAA